MARPRILISPNLLTFSRFRSLVPCVTFADKNSFLPIQTVLSSGPFPLRLNVQCRDALFDYDVGGALHELSGGWPPVVRP